MNRVPVVAASLILAVVPSAIAQQTAVCRIESEITEFVDLPLHFPPSEKIRKKFLKTLGLSETICGKIAVLLRKKFLPHHAFRFLLESTGL